MGLNFSVEDIALLQKVAHGCVTQYVSPGGTDSGVGSADAPWLTIAYACAHAVANSLVIVGPGSFDEGANVLKFVNNNIHCKFVGCPIVKTSISDSSAVGSSACLDGGNNTNVWWEGPVILYNNGSAGQTIYAFGSSGSTNHVGPAAGGFARFSHIHAMNFDTDVMAWVPQNTDTALIVEGCRGRSKWDAAIMQMKDGWADFRDCHFESIGGSVGQGGPPSNAHVFLIQNNGSGTAYITMNNVTAEARFPASDSDAGNDAVALGITNGTGKTVVIASRSRFRGLAAGGSDLDLSIAANGTVLAADCDYDPSNSTVGGSVVVLPSIQPSSIATNAITAASIASNAIAAAKIASGAITSAKFASGAITSTVAPNLDAAVSTRATAGDALAVLRIVQTNSRRT